MFGCLVFIISFFVALMCLAFPPLLFIVVPFIILGFILRMKR